jgi:mannosyltransferase OCH1-like enzyme
MELFEVDFYTRSLHKNFTREILNVGTSDHNTKVLTFNKSYRDASFYPRKFENWPDTFDVKLIKEDTIEVRRTDSNLGWGSVLLIDVEHRIEEVNEDFPLKEIKIPRVIYQTFKSRNLSKGMYDAVNSWKDLNPSYEHYFYDDEASIEFIKKFYDSSVLDAYLSLIPGAFKADLWRCCVLFEKGGVYVDCDMVCLKQLDSYLNESDEFIVARDDPMSKKFLYNAFMACVPKHAFMQKQIENIVYNVKNKVNCYHLDVAGPGLLGKSVNSCLNRSLDHDFELGRQTIEDKNITILFHDWKNKSISLDNESFVLTEYPGKNKEMDSLKIPTYYSLFQKGMVYQEIPRTIYYTTHDSLGINGYMVESFKKNKHWKMLHYNDRDRIKFFENNRENFKDLLGVDVSSFYDTLQNGGERADFWRYCIIYLNGGVYVDADTYCSKPLDEWILGYKLILGIEGNLPRNFARSFGMDQIGLPVGDDKIVSVCNWALAASPKHDFFKNIILDIYNNPVKEGVIMNTGPGRITRHTFKYFADSDFSSLDHNDIIKEQSILFNINKFGSNQPHSNARLSIDPFKPDADDVYIVHMFEGSWRTNPNKDIITYKSNLGCSHNLSIKSKANGEGYIGVSRLDKDTSRTKFMKKIGDCRSLLETHYDSDFNLLSEEEKPISNFKDTAKFEDYRIFTFNGKDFHSVSYIDENFNTKVALLDENYCFLGDVKIDMELNTASFTGEDKIWEKNWLFFEKDNELYFIYSTIPNYTVYKCNDFNKLEFIKFIDIKWPLKECVSSDEFYFTKKISVGGSASPILLKDKDVYLYVVHTRSYSQSKYNHYAILLDKNLNPIKLCERPIISKYLEYGLCFVNSVLENKDYLIFSGGLEDNKNFVWQLSKNQIFKKIGLI